MALADILYWLGRLLQHEAWGWTRDERLLARYLGLGSAWRLRAQLSGDYRMGVKLQRRVALALSEILAGNIVCERRLCGHKIISQALHADNPVPLNAAGPARAVVNVSAAGVKLVLKPHLGQVRPAASMPSFSEIWAHLR